MSFLRRAWIVWMLAAVVYFAPGSVDAQSSAVRQVGLLGRPEAISISGNKQFTLDEIRSSLAVDPVVLDAGHPTATLDPISPRSKRGSSQAIATTAISTPLPPLRCINRLKKTEPPKRRASMSSSRKE